MDSFIICLINGFMYNMSSFFSDVLKIVSESFFKSHG